jgi:single-stranded-DNA-specific exonuclease
VPQINALGRLTDPRRGVNFLISSQKKEVEKIGSLLWELNQERKALERSIFDEIEQGIQQKKIDLEKENVIVSVSSSWPPGVVGLVASRLVSSYGKPAIILHIHDGIAKGSCRSIPGFNIFNALQKSSDLLLYFGGHAYAAGLTLEQAKIDELKSRLEGLIAQELTSFDLKPKINLDAEVILPELTKKFIMDMEYLEPFGNKNEQPSFYIKRVSLVQKPLLLKDLHVKCHIFADGIIKPIIFFNRPELFQKLMNQESEFFDVAAHVVENYWNGRTNIELLGLDIAKCEE